MPAFKEADGSHLVDLPTLTTFEGRFEPDGDYDGLDFDGLSLSGQRAHRARLTQSRIHDCDLDEVQSGVPRGHTCENAVECLQAADADLLNVHVPPARTRRVQGPGMDELEDAFGDQRVTQVDLVQVAVVDS
jgi:uncharacterized protein YjbI with pentapeptide repeats